MVFENFSFWTWVNFLYHSTYLSFFFLFFLFLRLFFFFFSFEDLSLYAALGHGPLSLYVNTTTEGRRGRSALLKFLEISYSSSSLIEAHFRRLVSTVSGLGKKLNKQKIYTIHRTAIGVTIR